MRIFVPLLVAMVAFMSCAPARYVYSPTRTTGAEISGATAASYDIPREAPQGRVELAVFGIAPLEGVRDATNKSPLAVRLVLVVTNRSNETWTMRPAEQRVELTPDDELAIVYPTIAYAPAIEIAPGATRRVTLAFPLPEGVEDESDLPELSAVWVVHAGERIVTQRTPFARFQAGPAPAPRMPLSPGGAEP